MHSVGIVTTFDCNRHNSRQKWLVFEPFAGFLLSAFTLSPFGWARYPFLPEHWLFRRPILEEDTSPRMEVKDQLNAMYP